MKRSIIRILFFAETVGFLCMHIFGPQGIRVFQQLTEENSVIEQSIERCVLRSRSLIDVLLNVSLIRFIKKELRVSNCKWRAKMI